MSTNPGTVDVTAIMPAHVRVQETLNSLARIHACHPAPAEILVYVDGANEALIGQIKKAFPEVTILASTGILGPGGARNHLLRAASHELIASFDDDSHPVDGDFFAILLKEFEHHPRAAMFAANVHERSRPEDASLTAVRRTASFVGCGCAYRRSTFLETSGYVPLPLAYGMEEVDLAMRLHSMDKVILQSPNLRVYHDTSLANRDASEVNAAVTSNAALLVFLRYPVVLWPLGILQMARTILDLVKQKRVSGIWSGIMNIPRVCADHRGHRKPLSTGATLSYLKLRRRCARENIAP
jgi:GT2 family glycosyltransferase